MARESLRRRFARRFGSPERLADKIVDVVDPRQWSFFYAESKEDLVSQFELFRPVIQQVQEELIRCPVFLVENACRVYWDSPKDDWRYRSDFPNSAPPFPCFFMESSHPGTIVCSDGKQMSKASWCPDQWGVFFWAEDCDGLDFEVYPDSEKMKPSVRPPSGCQTVRLEDARWEMRCVLIGSKKERLSILPVQMVFAIGSHGEILAEMAYAHLMSDHETMQEAGSMFQSLLKPIFLSLSFLNCKNVVQTEHQPNPAINRERRKAGMKPFVRYHTINIEPMKKVLKTEGQIETEGLKKALHICRGHFSTYSEEKPLFGKVAGTFWVPAHTRGSLKQGYVVSDYNVQAPVPPAPHGGGEA